MIDEARLQRFDRWSARLLWVALALSVVGTYLVLTAEGDVLAWSRLAFAALQVPAIAALLITISGLGSGKSWARPAAIGLLAVLLAIGVIEIVAALGRSSIHFPLLAIAALVVLWRAPSGSILSGTRPADRARVATLVVLYVVPLIGNSILGWAAVPGRTALAVGERSLAASVRLDCGAIVLILRPDGAAPPPRHAGIDSGPSTPTSIDGSNRATRLAAGGVARARAVQPGWSGSSAAA